MSECLAQLAARFGAELFATLPGYFHPLIDRIEGTRIEGLDWIILFKSDWGGMPWEHVKAALDKMRSDSELYYAEKPTGELLNRTYWDGVPIRDFWRSRGWAG